MIYQPYLIAKGRIVNHRTLGMIGFLLAGGFLFTGISLLDIPLKLIASSGPDSPGPPPMFYYGTLVVEFLLTVATAVAVLQSIIHRKDVQNHSWWLICSGFYMMGPALGRGMIRLWDLVLPPDQFPIPWIFGSTELIYVVLLILFARKFASLRHPATILGFSLVVVRLLRFPIGSNEAVQQFLDRVIQWM
ncbi:MAG: hypothetical protein AAFQ87_21790 [Bacteroidota bacterium]